MPQTQNKASVTGLEKAIKEGIVVIAVGLMTELASKFACKAAMSVGPLGVLGCQALVGAIGAAIGYGLAVWMGLEQWDPWKFIGVVVGSAILNLFVGVPDAAKPMIKSFLVSATRSLLGYLKGNLEKRGWKIAGVLTMGISAIINAIEDPGPSQPPCNPQIQRC